MLIQPPPTSIYLDTSAVIAAMFEEHVHHALCGGLIVLLVSAGSQVHFSQILWLELSQALAQLPRDPAPSPALRRAYRLHRWDADAHVRERWLAAGLQRCNVVIGRFASVSEVPFDRPVWEASLDIMARFQLRSHDAIHVATARAVGVRDFATFDDHFRRVPDLRLWLI